MNFKEIASKIKENIEILYFVFKKQKLPWYVKALIGLTIAYALSPIDLIPDFIPLIGYLDDLLILPFLIFLCIKIIPNEILTNVREEKKEIDNLKPEKKLVYAVPTIFIWVLLTFAILKKILTYI